MKTIAEHGIFTDASPGKMVSRKVFAEPARVTTRGWSLAALRRRANTARQFPTNTCPASRHLHEMADALARGEEYDMFVSEPKHCAETILSVLISLWDARTEIAKLRST